MLHPHTCTSLYCILVILCARDSRSNATSCFQITDEEGEITYRPSKQITGEEQQSYEEKCWSILARQGYNIKINLIKVDLNNTNDSIIIRDGTTNGNILANITEKNYNRTYQIISSENAISIIYHYALTDGNKQSNDVLQLYYNFIDVFACHPNPCQNHGRCDDLLKGYKCTCQESYTGANCETYMGGDVSPCSSRPCLNGALCSRIRADSNSYECHCPGNYTGIHCERTKEVREVPLLNDTMKQAPTEKMTSHKSEPMFAVYFPVGILLSVGLVIVILVVGFYRRRKGTSDNSPTAGGILRSTALDRTMTPSYNPYCQEVIIRDRKDSLAERLISRSDSDAFVKPTDWSSEDYSTCNFDNAENIYSECGPFRNKKNLPGEGDFYDDVAVRFKGNAKESEDDYLCPITENACDDVYYNVNN